MSPPGPAEARQPAAAAPAPPADHGEARRMRRNCAQKYPSPAYDILQMSNVMQKMAQHMVHSVQTSPHVAAVHEVDMTRWCRHRCEHAAAFEQREGFKLTFTPYIVDAVVQAPQEVPAGQRSVEGDEIIRKNFINLGIAVASENGLIVPVIQHAEEKNFLGARPRDQRPGRAHPREEADPGRHHGGHVHDLELRRVRDRHRDADHQPAAGRDPRDGRDRRSAPVVINDAIAIRSIAYFTLSFDHRIIDGALGGMFLEEIVQNLERFDGDDGVLGGRMDLGIRRSRLPASHVRRSGRRG